MGQNVYSSETKWAVVREKMEGKLTNREIMGKYGIKSRSQIKTWMRWYRNGQIYRFDQPSGKQYAFGHGPESASESEIMNKQTTHLKMENEILKKYLEMKRGWIKE